MPKKIAGQGILFTKDEFTMIKKVGEKYLIPCTTKFINADVFEKCTEGEGGFLLPIVARSLDEKDLPELKERLSRGETKPKIIDEMNTTETNLINFLQTHFNTKSIHEAKILLKMEGKKNN